MLTLERDFEMIIIRLAILDHKYERTAPNGSLDITPHRPLNGVDGRDFAPVHPLLRLRDHELEGDPGSLGQDC